MTVGIHLLSNTCPLLYPSPHQSLQYRDLSVIWLLVDWWLYRVLRDSRHPLVNKYLTPPQSPLQSKTYDIGTSLLSGCWSTGDCIGFCVTVGIHLLSNTCPLPYPCPHQSLRYRDLSVIWLLVDWWLYRVLCDSRHPLVIKYLPPPVSQHQSLQYRDLSVIWLLVDWWLYRVLCDSRHLLVIKYLPPPLPLPTSKLTI